MIKIAAQQPYFLPDFYFFYKIFVSDIFLIADHLHFRKQSPISRTQLNTSGKKSFLTVPVVHTADPQPPIREVTMDSSPSWKRKHLRTLATYFHQTPYFEHYFPILEEIYSKDFTNLADFLIAIIRWQVELLFPRREIHVASQEGIANLSDLIHWCEKHSPVEWLVYPQEVEYYRVNLSNFSHRLIELPGDIPFPRDYSPRLPLLVLFFLRGPQTVVYFKPSTQ